MLGASLSVDTSSGWRKPWNEVKDARDWEARACAGMWAAAMRWSRGRHVLWQSASKSRTEGNVEQDRPPAAGSRSQAPPAWGRGGGTSGLGSSANTLVCVHGNYNKLQLIPYHCEGVFHLERLGPAMPTA
jgi:hypothetical protein